MKKETNDESVYIRLAHSDAVEAKKDFLEMTASVINMQLMAERLKKLGKEETSQRSCSKKQVKAMISEVNGIMEKMPKVKIERHREHKEKEELREEQPIQKVVPAKKEKEPEIKKIERKTLNEELLDIKRKIESLK